MFAIDVGFSRATNVDSDRISTGAGHERLVGASMDGSASKWTWRGGIVAGCTRGRRLVIYHVNGEVYRGLQGKCLRT